MHEAHVKVRLKPSAPQVGENCPVSANIFQVGDDIVICQQSGVAFSAKHWAEAVAMWSDICPYCDLPLEASYPQEAKPKPKKTEVVYTPTEFRQQSVSIPLWALVTTGAAVLVTLGLFIGLLLSRDSSDQSKIEADAAEEQLISRNIDGGNLPTMQVVSESTPTRTPTQPTPKVPTPTKTTTRVPPSPTNTRRPTATRTPRPTATPKPQQASFASGCEKTAKGEFANLWRTYQQELGCPRHSEPAYGQFAEMPFERGHLFWIGNIDIFGDTRQIIAIFGGQNEGDTGAWSVHQDTWNGQGICGVPAPPAGLYLPDRGIAKVWCEIDGINRLGYATAPAEFAPNRGIDAMQNYEKGVVFRDSDGHSRALVYMLLWDSMTYRRVRY
jgi:hypothetical protein